MAWELDKVTDQPAHGRIRQRIEQALQQTGKGWDVIQEPTGNDDRYFTHDLGVKEAYEQIRAEQVKRGVEPIV